MGIKQMREWTKERKLLRFITYIDVSYKQILIL